MASTSSARLKTNENIQVYLRVRPMNERERNLRSQEAVKVISSREVVARDSRNSKKFTFDRSFGPESSQSDVYMSVCAPLIEEVLAGYNCTIFAYGQTGTGKTHTMIGDECPNAANSWDQNSQIGMIPRAVNHIFEELRILGVEFSMRISFLELYNEELSDLLSASECPIRIYDDNNKKGSIIVHGLEELPVHSSADVYKLLAKGQEKRKTASTLMNVQSSRSHTIFSILVHIREYNVDGEEVLKVGKLNLVDLAGSENINKAGSEKGIRVRESANINQSLLTLGRVITALVERTPHVPYRESKLTRLLQESLGGRTKTSIIATVSPGDSEETLSTLEYAHRAKNILNKPEINQKLTKKLALKEYSEEIDRLKRDLMACRSKNGIYLAEETYADMTCRLDAQNQELSEKQLTIKAMKDEMTKIQSVFNDISESLAQKETELAETYNNLHSTKAELTNTVTVLQRTNKKYHEKKEILANHVATEEALTLQAKELQNVADIASDDTHRLHNTIERRKLTEQNIVSVCDNFEKSMQNNVNDLGADIDDFNKQIDNELHTVAEYIDNSTSRSNNFAAVVYEKFDAQRQLCENNSENFKKMLAETMTDELRLTDEQMIRIESVISQSIGGVQEFNERLMQEMMKPMLSVINEQNANLLEKESIMLEMVRQHRTSISNFCAVQTTKLQKLSLDTTNFIETCRSAVESGLTKNIGLAEKMCALLEEWQANNENMKTIAPTLSESVEMMNSATKSQIAEIANINEENEKRSDELNNELKAVSEAIEQHTETNQNEITDIIDSVNDHTKLFSVSLKSSKCKIFEQFEMQKKQAAKQFKDIESNVVDGITNVISSAADIVDDIKSEDSNLMDDLKKYLNSNTTLKTIANKFCTTSKEKLCDWRNYLSNFHKNELKMYTASGETPVKRDFYYPKVLAATSPHARIIQKFWSTHNGSDLDVSATSIFEENETKTSEVVDDAETMSASVNDNDEISVENSRESLAIMQPTSNRILNEISTSLNSSTASMTSKVPLQKLDMPEIAQKKADVTHNFSCFESNKENF